MSDEHIVTDFSGRRFQIAAPPGVTWEDLVDRLGQLTVDQMANYQAQRWRKEIEEGLVVLTHGYTGHGHPCCFEAPRPPKPIAKVPCGLKHCQDCQIDLRALHQPKAVPATPYLDPARAAAYEDAQKTLTLAKQRRENHAMSGGSRCEHCNGNLDVSYEQGGWHAADCVYYQLIRADNVNADLDEISSKWLAECGACLGVSGYNKHTCEENTSDPRPVIASLITEVRRLRALMLSAVNKRMPDERRQAS